ncbi:MAG: FkbM family methyltransferase [Pseudomonadota bacterium]
MSKARKLLTILRYADMRRALFKHQVAAATEHLGALAMMKPAALVDVGANKGQFSLACAALFPDVTIHAFEPLPQAASRFDAVFAGRQNVHLHRHAIGTVAGQTTFHVADREDSSSLLEPQKAQREAYGVSSAGQMQVEVKPLADALDVSLLPSPRALKLDVQGAELDALQSAGSLSDFDFIYAELSFIELYSNQPLSEDVYAYLRAQGFALRGVFNLSETKAFGPTQVDALFVKAA